MSREDVFLKVLTAAAGTFGIALCVEPCTQPTVYSAAADSGVILYLVLALCFGLLATYIIHRCFTFHKFQS